MSFDSLLSYFVDFLISLLKSRQRIATIYSTQRKPSAETQLANWKNIEELKNMKSGRTEKREKVDHVGCEHASPMDCLRIRISSCFS